MSSSRPLARLARPSVLLLALAGASVAQRRALAPVQPPLRGVVERAGGALAITGDSPLVFREGFAGRVDAVVDVIAFDFGDDTGGTFEVAGVPPGAAILRAWLLVTSFDPRADVPVSATFAGEALPARPPDVADFGGSTPLHCCLYRFDVTAQVAGDGSYAYQAVGNQNGFGDALVVVFEHPSLPERVIALADGAESLMDAATTTAFDGLPPGAGELVLFTAADDADSGPEEVRWNGATVAGPGQVFLANQGRFASLVTLAVDAVGGTNVLELRTEEEWLGLHLALVKVGAQKVVLGFETEDDGVTPLVNGQAVEGGDEMGALVRIDGFPASGLTAAVFDSTPLGPNDPSQDVDLLVGRGNVLILQERPLQTVPGIYDRPNDDARGGRFEIDFLGREALVCTLDLADVDGGDPGSSWVTLRDAAGRERVYTVPSGWTEDLLVHGPPAVRTLDLTTLAPQQGFAAVATAFEDAGFEPERVVALDVRLGGSGALDDLTFFLPAAPLTVDFEDLGLAPGGELHPDDLVGIASGGFLLEPTLNSSFLDVHAANALPSWPFNGTTNLAGHDEIRMTRVGGGTFALHAFDFAGFLSAEQPFSVVASSGAVAHFVPDGVSDGPGGGEDFETFTLPAGFDDVESVLFVHTGAGTNFGTFHLDDLVVSADGLGAEPLAAASAPRPAAPTRPGAMDRDPLLR